MAVAVARGTHKKATSPLGTAEAVSEQPAAASSVPRLNVHISHEAVLRPTTRPVSVVTWTAIESERTVEVSPFGRHCALGR